MSRKKRNLLGKEEEPFGAGVIPRGDYVQSTHLTVTCPHQCPEECAAGAGSAGTVRLKVRPIWENGKCCGAEL